MLRLFKNKIYKRERERGGGVKKLKKYTVVFPKQLDCIICKVSELAVDELLSWIWGVEYLRFNSNN